MSNEYGGLESDDYYDGYDECYSYGSTEQSMRDNFQYKLNNLILEEENKWEEFVLDCGELVGEKVDNAFYAKMRKMFLHSFAKSLNVYDRRRM